MEGNEVHTAGNGRVYYGFVGGEKPSTGRLIACSIPWKRGGSWTWKRERVQSETVCGGRGKKVRTLAGAFEPIFTMTETRAACCSGVACRCPANQLAGR